MSFVRNAIFAVAVAAAIPVAATAQGPGGQSPEAGARRGGGMQQQMLMKDITLTAEQEAEMQKIRAATMEEMNALRGQPGTPLDSATRAKLGEVRKKQTANIRKVLTADQQKTFDANIAEMEKRMREMRRN